MNEEIDQEVAREFAIDGETIRTLTGEEWIVRIVGARREVDSSRRILDLEFSGPGRHNLQLFVAGESLNVTHGPSQRWILNILGTWLEQPDSEKKKELHVGND